MSKVLFAAVLILNTFLVFAQSEFTTSINGTIIHTIINPDAKKESENGIYWCKYDIKEVTDEMRKLVNFSFYENDKLLFTMTDIPGSDVDISNSGNIVFYDHSYHFNRKLKIHFYSKTGSKLTELELINANLFGFSLSGNLFGAGSPDGIQIISVKDLSVQRYPKGFQFAVSEDDKLVAIASEDKIEVFNKGLLIKSINTGFKHTRKVIISTVNDLIAAIDKRNLKVYSISDGHIKFSYTSEVNKSNRDLKLIDNKIALGVHIRTKTKSQGELISFDQQGNIQELQTGQSRYLSKSNVYKSSNETDTYDNIPWPFSPFDSMRTIWNHYEQHMGGYGSGYSYLHQGLDIITPIAEPTYAVRGGVVKCVLTTGGYIYWRLSICDSNTQDRSNGWLYAHLIENTIQFDVGDTVEVHDYLADIVEWTSEWGHIHFVEINDSGFVWLYDDNEWGINFNPLLALTPVSDETKPVIDDVFPDQKFGFCTNETSNYLQPDSLSGEVDIIVKAFDYAGDSEWQQPAFKIDYWIKRIPDDQIIVPRKMAHILNHSYPFYSGDNFEPYAAVMYKRDDILTPTTWMSTVRNFHHVITNSDADSLITLEERNNSLNTADYYDSEYRIYVEAFDQSGNSTIDSMDVYFKNGISSVDDKSIPNEFILYQNFPNPFNPSTKIKFSIPNSTNPKSNRGDELVTLKVYDILGNEVATLLNEVKTAGSYEVEFNAIGGLNTGGEVFSLSSGIYFYRITAGNLTQVKKMLLLR
ncbi:MAG: T9SS type A sorting domain-containing protein [Ignavibacterium sp.]|nr:T9SS type A sorting domain-containing protein [Ignavibacterium sp.]